MLLISLIPVHSGEDALEGATSAPDTGSSVQPLWPESHTDSVAGNLPPQQPSVPFGPVLMALERSSNYSAYAIDPDGDPLIYSFDWGDGSYSMLMPLDSGTEAMAGHIWSRAGIYQVRVRATDYYNASSPWSPPLVVVINSPPPPPSIPAGKIIVLPGEKASFSTSGYDTDADPLRYTFDWGDGSFSTTNWTDSGVEVRMEHFWEKAGTYSIKIRAEDRRNASSSWSSSLEVVVNSPPMQPSISAGPRSARPGERVSFSAIGEDPDADPLHYTFDWGDGSFSTTNWTDSGSAVRMEHCWEKAGSYLIMARAHDCRNNSSDWSTALNIVVNTLPDRPDPPAGPVSGYALVPYSFQASANDPDGDALNYTIDWGDWTSESIDLIGSGVNFSAKHAWKVSGTYRVRVIAADRMGGDWSEERSITIAPNEQPKQPRDLYGLRAGYAGNVYSYFTMASDPDGDAVKYVLDWGDGIVFETDYNPSGSLENASHIWSRSGEYSVRAAAVDEKGAPSPWSGPFPVAIAANDPPEQPDMPYGPAAGQCSISQEYTTSATDPDGDPVKYVFDWGDGTTSWTGLGFLNSGEESAVSHKWMKPGVYQIKAAALDDKGSISDWSGVLLVKME